MAKRIEITQCLSTAAGNLICLIFEIFAFFGRYPAVPECVPTRPFPTSHTWQVVGTDGGPPANQDNICTLPPPPSSFPILGFYFILFYL
jgi:hypothetical protein